MGEGKPLQWEFAEEAHEIGKQVAKEILGGKYEFVLTPHIDKGHIHNHLIFNAVSFTDHSRHPASHLPRSITFPLSFRAYPLSNLPKRYPIIYSVFTYVLCFYVLYFL